MRYIAADTTKQLNKYIRVRDVLLISQYVVIWQNSYDCGIFEKRKNSKFLCYLEVMKIDIKTNKSIIWQSLKIRKLKLCIWKIDLNNEYCKQWRWSREMVKLWIIYNCIIPKNIICHENILDCYKKKISYRNYFIVEDLIISPFRYIDWIGSTNC